jgi:hypothetical protein
MSVVEPHGRRQALPAHPLATGVGNSGNILGFVLPSVNSCLSRM